MTRSPASPTAPRAPAATLAPAAAAPPLAFRELLAALRQRGFALGVDQQLRLVRLLDMVEGECSPADLRLLLCPVLATDEHQQRVFHEVFDELYPRLEPAPRPGAKGPRPARSRSAARGTEPPSPRRSRLRAWPFVVAGAGLVLAVFAIGVLGPLAVERTADRGPAAPSVGEVGTESPAAISAPAARTEPEPPAARIAVLANQSARRTLMALPWLLLALFELYRRRRARVVLRRAAVARAPFVWPLRLDRPAHGPFDAETLRQVSRSLRRRLEGEVERLDVGRSVAATVAAAGRVQLRYRAATKVPEYLALIDRGALGDHAAGFANELSRALEAEGLFVQRFFFDRDPRACQDLDGGPIALSELADRFAGDRLLLFTDGATLLDPIGGGLQAWTETFFAWQDRAVLSPVPTRDWRLAEIALASRFLVVPASLEGLLALAERFESESSPETAERGGELDGAPAWATEPSAERVGQLRHDLGEATFQWLCACAVHSELQWDLTLYLATLPVMEPGLLTEDRLLRLVRLPWFRAGRLPGRWRWWLIQELAPEIEAAVRAELARLLELHPPPDPSVAGESRALQLALHQAWLDREQGRRRGPGRRRLRSFPASRWRRDEAALRLLETLGPSILDLVVPRRARRALLRNGLSMAGLRTWPLVLLALLATGALWLAMRSGVGARGGAESAVESAPQLVVAVDAAVVVPPPQELDASPLPDAEREEISAPLSTAPGGDAPGSAEGASIVVPATDLGSPVPVLEGEGGETTVGVVAPPVAEGTPLAGRIEPAAETAEAPERLVPPARDSEAAAVLPPPAVNEAAPVAAAPVVTELGSGGVALRMPLPREIRREGIEVPLERYQRPVWFSKIRLEAGTSLGGRPWIDVAAQLANGGGAGRYATLSVELLDAIGQPVATDSKRKKLDKGADEIRVRFRLDEAQAGAVGTLRLSVVSEYDPGPIRRLVDRIGGESPELPPVDPSRVRVVDGRAVLLLPTNLGDAELGLFLQPLDLLTVTTRSEGSRLTAAVVISNPSGQDRLVTLTASLVDGDGEVVTQRTDRRVVESGELEKRLDVLLRLTPEQRAAGAQARLELASIPE